MAPLSARWRQDQATTAARLQSQLNGQQLVPPVTCASPRAAIGVASSPRPIVRGPLGGSAKEATLTNEENERAEKAFSRHDHSQSGEVDLGVFYEICKSLELPIAKGVAKEWLAGKSEARGLMLEDFKQLYAKILAAQTPAVRAAAGRKPIGLPEMAGTEAQMRTAFNKYARAGKLSTDGLQKLLVHLNFPDIHGDRFDRFLEEFLELCSKEEPCTHSFHEFITCVNLLIEFCESREGQER
mmetsp:Transcript_56779/g.122735  ORF Transcript_56779/g.122735 Transcript_56779/m.122735 type:complete len:241 (-) Transcript_56779:86-808(-)